MAKSNKDSFYIERGQWMDYVSSRRDFTHVEFRIAYFIASKTNYADGCMWYGVKRIAREVPASLASVEKTLAKLEEFRLIQVGPRKMGAKTVTAYAFRMPLDAEDQAFRAEKPKRKKTGGRKKKVSLNETVDVSANETKSNKA